MVVRNPLPRSEARRARARARDDTRYLVRLQRAWRAFGASSPRLRREIARYASVQADRVRGAVRRTAIAVVLGVLGAIAGVALLATAVVLLVVGLAGGLAAAFGSAWLGNLVGGAAVLLLVAGGLAFALRRDRKRRMRALVERYARFDEPRPTPVVGSNGQHGGNERPPVNSGPAPRPEAVRP
jgi:hypothetical protein